MKRLVFIILCIVLCLGCLVGCGKRVAVEPEAGTMEDVPAEAEAPVEEAEPPESAAQPEATEETPPLSEETEAPAEEIPERPAEEPEEEPPAEETVAPVDEPEEEPEVPEAEPEEPTSTETEEPVELEEPMDDSRVLYALGDSIASGYALRSPYTERYSALLIAALSERDGLSWEERNFAVAGDTSTDLLNRLRSGQVTGLEEADEITVCIGANNVLGPAGTFLMSYGSALFSEEPETSVSEAYEVFRKAAGQGVATLTADLKSVMDLLRAANPTAPITFMTVYNPYRNIDYDIDLDGLPIPFSLMSDTYVGMVNDALRAAAPELGFELVDVYAAFEQDESGKALVNADDAESLFADPHPTAEGHRVIAETFFEEMGN